jgi:HD-like signal output (HDOD) protein
VLNSGTFEMREGRTVKPVRFRLATSGFDDLPDLPVLPETLLMMELSSSQFSVNLHDLSRLILGDLGATLQILRLAGREFGDTGDRPLRIEDCICALGVQACLIEASRHTAVSDIRQYGMLEVWCHSREIAASCRAQAGSLCGNVSPDEAYLVGLCHALGGLPALLRWGWSERCVVGSARIGLRLAERWRLPPSVQEYFLDMERRVPSGPWVELVRSAHEQTRRSSVPCPASEGSGLQVLRAR